MKFSEKPLSPEKIKIAEQEDEAACRDGRLCFLELKYEYTVHASCPSHYYDYHVIELNIDGPCGGYNKDYTPARPEKDFIMPHGGYYAVMKECIARKVPWEELLNAEPYLTWLREKQAEESQDHYKYVPAFEIYENFSDYFNRGELQAGFTWEELRENDPLFELKEMYLEPMKLFKKNETDLLKKHPEHYDEVKKHFEKRQKEWEDQCLPRLNAWHSARWKICEAATKFFLENDELPWRPDRMHLLQSLSFRNKVFPRK